MFLMEAGDARAPAYAVLAASDDGALGALRESALSSIGYPVPRRLHARAGHRRRFGSV